MPMTFRTSRDINVTPSAFRSNQNALVSFFDEGRVDHIANVATAKLIVPKFPVLDASYTNDKTENTITQRTEIADVLNLGATYAPPKADFDLLPGNSLTFRP